jgi:membrane-bound inhibitor of C-type lysozyme
MSIKSLLSNGVLVIMLLLCSNALAADETSKKIPKWKKEYMAKVANASKVCELPTINPKVDPNNITTGFYTINLIPDEMQLYLDADENGKPEIINLPEKNRQWLISRVGAGLYKISACFDQKPLCLSAAKNNEITLQTCHEFGYGDQVWWLKGFLHGTNAGGWFLGNDGVGQMECLIADHDENGLALQTCSNNQNGWRFTRLEKFDNQGLKKKNNHTKLDFLKNANITNYECDSGENVSAYYDEIGDYVMIDYKNNSLTLKSIISGSGAKFGNSSAPWGWWTKGTEGFIYQTGGDEPILDRCIEIVQNVGEYQEALTDNNIAERKWSVYGQGETVSVADCIDCEEDIGMLIQCQGKDQPALVTLHWLASDNQIKEKTQLLSISVNNRIYERQVKTEYYGMIGYTPQFLLTKDDPLILALQNANKVGFNLDGSKTNIGLSGSKNALNQFKLNCGWD